ncbi:hypothetical protein N658DRAFT_501645 [Parathielavia hyrcaniae]|uniref:Uncharacterized protein n=1 Tax=Parathielavia hyrcaniae TaxID=113614 RepID=A0AAN6PST9_9PEZI|nr:hypothetical protein N658DRAFT_501645 [Parathielavia hyrcaniae]
MHSSAPEVAFHEGLEVHHPVSDLEAVSGGQQWRHQDMSIGTGKALSPKKRICGLSKSIFWLAVAVTVLAVGIIGLGVGVGISMNNRAESANVDGVDRDSSSSSTAIPSLQASITQTQPTSTTSTPSSTIFPTSTSTSTTTSSAAATPEPSNICPAANGTIVTPAVGSVRYRVACDSDFGGSGKQDLASYVTATFGECVDLCNSLNYFQDRADVGCTWNVAGTGTQTPGTCWCSAAPSRLLSRIRGMSSVCRSEAGVVLYLLYVTETLKCLLGGWIGPAGVL